MTALGFEPGRVRAEIDGTVLVPGDPGFDEARRVWNGDIHRMPSMVVRPTSARDVATCVRRLTDAGADFTVRGGGHNYAGHAVADGAVMIDLSMLNSVVVDPDSRRARCGGGATWAQLDAATQVHGLAVTGGFISDTGVGGLTLGGGLGWLTRRAGLTCDNLVSAQVVTAAGEIVTASEEENPDLHWALRGGGGNFGIVTEFGFRLHQVPPMVQLTLLFWTPEDAAAGLAAARDALPDLPPSYGVAMFGLSAPPEPFVPEHFQGRPGCAVGVVGWADPARLAAATAPLRARAPKPAWELVTPIPYLALQQMFDAAAPWGLRSYEKSLYVEELSEAVLEAIVAAVPRKNSPLTLVPLFPLDSAYCETADEDTAFSGPRSPGWAINISAACPDPAVFDAERAWVRALWDTLRVYARDDAGYVNFLVENDPERIRHSYGAKYERLAAVKAVWDPRNVFRHNANIPPNPALVP
ncbi:FAD-binding oxidoreductase [Nocardia blacklockiae]|uniref:FAD-binding oxidoreductase n=1 Tax=Nocardia blacklockiae TaxID=480036 RepID=UPI001893F4B0|nr:FAD-binding oxidoreductase [Nocardia blacklockiae]MBF6170616.1 FAD-binding oxidoreductase [Nocardia blacklockiae]